MSNIKELKNPNKIFEDAQDFLPLLGIDYVELYVGNSKQSTHYYKSVFGFQSEAYSGLETGNKETVSHVIRQEKIRLVLTSSYKKDTAVNKHFNKHGDGVKFIAFLVDDATKSFEETVKRGAKPYMNPVREQDENGYVVRSGIYTYGETIHLFVERNNYDGVFLPGFKKWDSSYNPQSIGLKYIDHVVGNVGWNEMNKWCKFYKEVLGFSQIISFDDDDISTEYTALMSKVMSNGNGRVKFPINEPAKGINKSQIEEYLDFYNGPGVQHLALATDDIINTVSELRKRGVEMLYVPETYYDTLIDRVGDITEDIKYLKEYGILIDRDDDGYLLQIFTKPLVDRPTLFFEIIQRKGAKSFGKGNFKALFVAIEAEQKSRGTL
ncbi:MAG: 4-hydroxyphenylpyruvate dioxygenase [Flavobacteriaceae bacterium]|jgi:4-hydroxyphenylpyruvate dioxygenase|nr:4-hydroxyphenylpyruvate dioxygenase [Flavobacteriaceae bacterium]MBT4113004.1 4-hydroxyphenylpyruvate dioxygenase [Flavobacteriaceae bacterium]MBT4613797.1 4-hydroxyphenylpyruvate dioxygenase [Flavobacteriaceae bacterium]MBT5649835.1 4-hydroxyphenylpyruvate dioxygenase [Flavobacteriaceae bacterium]MBT5771940.1 4-hydroxyphenylpyruvate dioxygenase [Flavobacteriaceae bacterium]